mgnify:FL=1
MKVKGAFAIETLISVTIFMMAILALMMFTVIIRTEARMQYALNQTAKEISSYYYVLDKTGLGFGVKGNRNVEDMNKLIDGVSNLTKEEKTGNWKIDDFSNINDIYQLIKDKDPLTVIKSVFQYAAATGINSKISELIAPPLCQALMPKYIAGDNTDKYLQSMGVGNSIEDVNFSQSDFMGDEESINLVAVYKINTKSITFGMIDQELTICQTASVKAWKYNKVE